MRNERDIEPKARDSTARSKPGSVGKPWEAAIEI